MSEWTNKLFYGDNLEILRNEIGDESVDLIYLDPPFNSKATYNVLFKDKTDNQSEAQIEAFDDTWHWDKTTPLIFHELIMNTEYPRLANLMNTLDDFLGHNDLMAYLVMMAIRLIELHRVLKLTGSIYLHCDPTASHYLKLLMDAVFGYKCFMNEVIWCYRKWSASNNRFLRSHDTILFYKKEDNVFNPQFIPYSEGTYKRWKGKKQASKFENGKRVHQYSLDEESKGSYMPDWWEVSIINPAAKERMGYPTQKPETLLERIIKASSNENDVVLDPFCGCGTTVAVAERLNRRWIGIDITHLAVNLMENRLRDTFKSDLKPYDIYGTPKSLAGAIELASKDKYQFEWWALTLVGGRPDKKKGADKGIDGIMYFHDMETGKHKEVVIQVKAGHITANQIRDLAGVVGSRKHAEIGIFITLKEPTKQMRVAAADAGIYEATNGRVYRRIQILTIEEIFEGKQPEYPFRDTGGESPFTRAERYNGETSEKDLFTS